MSRVLVYLEKHPSWGLTPTVKNDKSKFTVIKGRARDKGTHYRNLIKCVVESLGDVRDPSEPVPAGEGIHKDALTIVVLRQRILAVGAKVAPDVKVSLEMAGRVAYLRFHYQGKVNQGKPKAPSFWDDIDAGLADVRGATGEAVEAMSLLFSRSLSDDLALYGPVNLDHLVTVSPALLD
ncbi:hypothetical protein DFH09DRAFT_1501545 [Mycena vulgaris]|nr:hypothetical protein DFH09DRAFT_1501545 [Mycena vulgaris]